MEDGCRHRLGLVEVDDIEVGRARREIKSCCGRVREHGLKKWMGLPLSLAFSTKNWLLQICTLLCFVSKPIPVINTWLLRIKLIVGLI